MSNENPEPILWINPQDMLKISRKLGLHLLGCFVTLMMHTVEANGVIDYDGAARTLTDVPQMDSTKAKAVIKDLIKKEVIRRHGDTLTLTPFGTSVVPDYDDWAPTDYYFPRASLLGSGLIKLDPQPDRCQFDHRQEIA